MAICATYIRFRKAYKVQGISIVEESKSPLQPALAWYGLFWTTFFGKVFLLSSIDGQ